MSQAGLISSAGGSGGTESFVTDAGTATPLAGEIDILGGTLINTSGASNMVIINANDEVVGSIVTDSGTCTPVSNAFNLLGGTGVDTSASGDTITITFDGSENPEIPTSFPTDSGTAVPALNALTVSGGNFVNTSGTGASVTINADTTLASTFATDSGTATSATNGITVTGGTGIDTSGATSVVTINAAATVPLSFNTDGSAATPSANALTIAGGTGITTSGSGSTVTVTLDNPVTVALGGSGRATATAYAVICGGTTATGAHQSIASVGTSGQILTSNGAAALPTFQDAPASGLTAPVIGTYRTVSSADDLEYTDYIVAVDTTGGAFTLGLLETSMSSGQVFVVKDIGGGCGTDNLTITPSSGNIDGSASFIINADYGAVNLVYDGTNFWVY